MNKAIQPFEDKDLKSLNACTRCHYLSRGPNSRCECCGEEEKGSNGYSGIIALLDPNNSYLAKLIKREMIYKGELIPGFYAVKLED